MDKDAANIEQLREQVGAWNREDWHALRNTLNAVAVTVAVMQERQKVNSETIDRIETTQAETRDYVRQQNGRVGILEQHYSRLDERSLGARETGAKWGGGMGTVAGLLGGLLAGFLKGAAGEP